MGHAEASTVIHAPREVVWGCLNDIEHTREWVTGLEDAQIVSQGAYGLGSVYQDTNRIGPFRQRTPWRITAFEPPTYQVHESDSRMLPSRMTLRLSPAEGGTALHMAVDYRALPQLGAFSRLLEHLVMNRVLAGVLRQNQAQLDQYLARRSR